MTTESNDEGQSYVVMPDGLAIQERLQQVSSDRFFHDQVIPRIMELAGAMLQPTELVESLESRLSEHADKRMLGIKALALADMEAIINNLVDDEDQREKALDGWAIIKIDDIERNNLSDTELRRAQRGYRQPKLPRKQKKKVKQAHEKEQAARRGTFTIDPKRLRR